MSAAILIVDDEAHILRLLRAVVERGGHHVVTATNGREALHLARTSSPPVALLDLGLPDRDGIELVKQFTDLGISVIVVSARDDISEKIAALDLGAADYVVKPFDTDELLARLRATLRSRTPQRRRVDVLQLGDVRLDLGARRIQRNQSEVHLAPKEYALLDLLARHAGRVLTHAQLLREVWGPAHEKDIEYLRVAVRAIRQKIEPVPSRPTFIRNEPGIGYRLMVPEAPAEGL
ncbi:transcriptional regulatory protein KdpE [Candidatus Phycosocius bacilliformis]|uniref:Transcriptional regulatory protein KdpE n=1 Tax=Candidatus Phycosocius bacilliformis TaxID=1445552 RepID=A0A2P2E942_9PROT|nr:response regulator transcription factor [Candidatus Phycosocius bacilliformis]GBF57579.1 transcriptional regulatory protein KdpE [Candidatus Phycosocius bacilliformis]